MVLVSCENDVLLRDREAKVANAFVAQDGGSLMDCPTADVEVDVVDAAPSPHRGLGREIDHVRAKGGDGSHRDDLAVNP